MVTEELQETLSNVPCGVCVYRVDRMGISPVYHNPAFYEIVGYSEEHIREVERETRYLGVHADDIVILKDKHVFEQGEPNTVLDVENLAKVFGVNAKMYQNCQNPEDKIIFPVSLVKN